MRIANLAGIVTGAVLLSLGINLPAIAQEAEPADTMANLLAVQLEAVKAVLSPELKDALEKSQQQWIEYRSEQCKFELSFAREVGRTKSAAAEDYNLRCIAKFNQQRLAELQRYLTALMQAAGQPQRAENGYVPRNCRLASLPQKFEVHGAGTYKGLEPSNFQIDSKGHETREVSVVVNKPGDPIVLVLSAYDPVIWKISRTPDTKIAAVLVGGYHNQAVLGIDKSTTLSIRSHVERSDCGAFYAYSADDGLLKANEIIKGSVGRELDSFVTTPADGRMIIGDGSTIDDSKLISSIDIKIEDYTAARYAPSGQRGLESLLEAGKIRFATQADIDAWVEKASVPFKKLNPDLKVRHRMKIGRTYVIIAPIEYPAGLFGAHSATFLIAEGVPPPTGSAGHSMIYYMDNGSCSLGPMDCPQ